MPGGPLDVVIVGAGVAGLAAVRLPEPALPRGYQDMYRDEAVYAGFRGASERVAGDQNERRRRGPDHRWRLPRLRSDHGPLPLPSPHDRAGHEQRCWMAKACLQRSTRHPSWRRIRTTSLVQAIDEVRLERLSGRYELSSSATLEVRTANDSLLVDAVNSPLRLGGRTGGPHAQPLRPGAVSRLGRRRQQGRHARRLLLARQTRASPAPSPCRRSRSGRARGRLRGGGGGWTVTREGASRAGRL